MHTTATKTTTTKGHEDRSRLLAKLIREILSTPEAREFEEVGDVVEALKYRCARLHIGWTNDDINNAIRLVASNRALVYNARDDRKLRRFHVEHVAKTITQADAVAILARLGVKL
jgi:head-tail adaptor